MTTPEEFVNEFNYMLNDAVGELDIDSSDELAYYMEAVASMMQDNCGEVRNFEVINNKGQIKLIGGDS